MIARDAPGISILRSHSIFFWIVILSGSNSFASRMGWRSRRSPSNFTVCPPRDFRSWELIGVLRLRSCFAMRSSYSAQDDRVQIDKESCG